MFKIYKATRSLQAVPILTLINYSFVVRAYMSSEALFVVMFKNEDLYLPGVTLEQFAKDMSEAFQESQENIAKRFVPELDLD